MDFNQKDEFIPVWEMALSFLKKQQDLRVRCAPVVTLRASETAPGFLGPGPFLGAGTFNSNASTSLKWDPKLFVSTVQATAVFVQFPIADILAPYDFP